MELHSSGGAAFNVPRMAKVNGHLWLRPDKGEREEKESAYHGMDLDTRRQPEWAFPAARLRQSEVLQRGSLVTGHANAESPGNGDARPGMVSNQEQAMLSLTNRNVRLRFLAEKSKNGWFSSDVMEFFGLDSEQENHLFYPGMQNPNKFGGRSLGNGSRPSSVAKGIRIFVDRV